MKKRYFLVLILLLPLLFFIFKSDDKKVTVPNIISDDTNRAALAEEIKKEEPSVKISRDIASIAPAINTFENKIIDTYKKNLEEGVDIKLYFERDYEKDKVYKISLVDKNGKKSNFHALIDSKTGAILKTWNKTQYEKRKPILLSGEGQEFY